MANEVKGFSPEEFDELAKVARLTKEQAEHCTSLVVRCDNPGFFEVEVKYCLTGKEE